MEVCMGGELFTLLHKKRMFGSQEHARYFSACVIEGFAYLHERHIVYRDLKPENMILDEKGNAKLCDLGLAKFCVGKAYTMCGTPEYMAPEVQKGQGYTRSVDWWTLGIFCYELHNSKPPFEGASPF